MFVVQKIASRGTATPAVARTMLQTIELMQPFQLGPKTREDLTRVSRDLMLRLMGCLDRSEPIIAQVTQSKQALAVHGVEIQAGGGAANLPAVVDLNANAEGFLFTIKQALRDVGGLFRVFHSQQFEHRFNQALTWATQRFGAGDPLSCVLTRNAKWIERVIEMRNALEHPGGTSGTVNICNFRVRQYRPPFEVIEPEWHRNAETPVPIADDMATIVDRTLVLYEDLLCACLLNAGSVFPVMFVEIPEPERDPVKPFRLRVSLRQPPL